MHCTLEMMDTHQALLRWQLTVEELCVMEVRLKLTRFAWEEWRFWRLEQPTRRLYESSETARSFGASQHKSPQLMSMISTVVASGADPDSLNLFIVTAPRGVYNAVSEGVWLKSMGE